MKHDMNTFTAGTQVARSPDLTTVAANEARCGSKSLWQVPARSPRGTPDATPTRQQSCLQLFQSCYARAGN